MTPIERMAWQPDLSMLRPVSEAERATRSPVYAPQPENPPTPNPFLRATLPASIFGTQPDALRQFYQHGGGRQMRIVAVNPSAIAGINSAITSATK